MTIICIWQKTVILICNALIIDRRLPFTFTIASSFTKDYHLHLTENWSSLPSLAQNYHPHLPYHHLCQKTVILIWCAIIVKTLIPICHAIVLLICYTIIIDRRLSFSLRTSLSLTEDCPHCYPCHPHLNAIFTSFFFNQFTTSKAIVTTTQRSYRVLEKN